MEIIRLPLNPFQMNCYICYDKSTLDCFIFDPGVYYKEEKEKLKNIIESKTLKVKKIFNTHGHLDHILGNEYAIKLTGAPVYAHESDIYFFDNAVEQARLFNIEIDVPSQPDKLISVDDVYNLGESTFRILHTPGHSDGSLSFINDENKFIICGDLVFQGSVGRTDLPGGNMELLLDSVKKLFNSVDDDYTLLPGHMSETTVGNERNYNQFLISLYGKD
ncbi:MAG: MBL fold metallo-hydrolase [Ignavibacteriaceae bacterium]|nr:MBL fold metallo-hydrolase [Ignavibacteriaceae bacterium]